jgi:hypothetical protein
VKKKRADENVVYKTEEMLKRETLERAAEEARLEALRPPVSPRKKKWDNYWYHYKWHTIGGSILAVLVIYFVQSVVFQVKPDISIVFASSAYVPQESIDALCAAVESEIQDFNGDGKVVVQADFTYLPSVPGAGASESAGAAGGDPGIAGAGAAGGSDAATESAGAAGGDPAAAQMDGALTGAMAADPQMEQAAVMKLMAVTAAGADPLYLLDDDLYGYFARMAAPTEYDGDASPMPAEPGAEAEEYSIFETLGGIAGAEGPLGDRLPIARTALAGEPGCELLGGFAFSLRPPANSKDETVQYHGFCLDLLKSLAPG